MKSTKYIVTALLTVSSAFTIIGCGDSSDKPASISTEAKVADMVRARKIFDESNKDWNSLPADKQAEYTKLVGGKPEDATRWWEKMKNPSGGSQLPTSATGGQ